MRGATRILREEVERLGALGGYRFLSVVFIYFSLVFHSSCLGSPSSLVNNWGHKSTAIPPFFDAQLIQTTSRLMRC